MIYLIETCRLKRATLDKIAANERINIMLIRKLYVNENAPIELLQMADPSSKFVTESVDRGKCYVAESAQTIIGVYILLPTKPGMVELVNIAVSEKEQGAGVGKYLTMDAIQRARRMGYKAIEIGTGNSSFGQLKLYQKCGFRIVGVDVDFFTRNYDEDIVENGVWCRDMIRLSQDL